MNGERGRVYFYQSELPYDPPDQASYTSASGARGWASYKVAENVADHEAWDWESTASFADLGLR
jgi:hypothetical protein